MKKRLSHATLLGMFLLVTVGSGAQAPGQDPPTEGKWDEDVLDWPVYGVDTVVLKNGKVFLSGVTVNEGNDCMLYDPVTGEITEFSGPVAPDFHNLYCSGHVALANGKILFTGGTGTVATTTIFDPDVVPPGSASWSQQDPGPTGRFYPTCTLLGDGTVLVMAGMEGSNTGPNTPAIFDPSQQAGENPSAQWRSMTDAEYEPRDAPICNPEASFHLDQYPFMFLLSAAPYAGKVIYAGSDDAGSPSLYSTLGTRTIDVSTDGWADVVNAQGGAITDPIHGGSAVMYRRNKIMKAGGRGADCATASDLVYTFDAEVANPSWTAARSMVNARSHYGYLLVLPDGNVMATSGKDDEGNFVLNPEIFDPDNPSAGWTEIAAMAEPRGTHSTAVLMPDARVLVAGGVLPTAQIFSPPYLFQGPRPTITGACGEPDTMCYGKEVSVTTPDADQVMAVSLIRPGSATHGFDFDQRFLGLAFTHEGSNELLVTAPATKNEAPPGHYMLYVLTGDPPSRVPSKGRFMLLSSGNGLDCDNNGNGISDDCDIAKGTSADCNCDGIPDECETLGPCCLPSGACIDTLERFQLIHSALGMC